MQASNNNMNGCGATVRGSVGNVRRAAPGCQTFPDCQTAIGFRYVITAADALAGFVLLTMGGDTVPATGPQILLQVPQQMLAVGAVFDNVFAVAGAGVNIQDVLKNGQTVMPPGYRGPNLARLNDQAYQAGINNFPAGTPPFAGDNASKTQIRFNFNAAVAANDILDGTIYVAPFYG